MSQAANIKNRMAEQLGVGGAFPAPGTLTGLAGSVRGLTEQKVAQLRSLGAAALDGRLDRDHLRSLAYDDAIREVQQLPGIGPFSAELIMVRGVGAPDSFPGHEKRLAGIIRERYGLADSADVSTVAEQWRPFRSWVGLLLRAAQ